MSQQTINKLNRLLEIERAKVTALQVELLAAVKHRNHFLCEKVDYELRAEQAAKILIGEARHGQS